MRQLFHTAFVHAVDKSGLSIPAVARALAVTTATVRGWVHGKHAITAEALTDVRIWAHFLRCVVVMERKARVI